MSTLALDLGTKTGWCITTHDHGVWDLKPRRFEGGGMRYVHFRRCLDTLALGWDLEQVVYEEVRRHKGTDAAHIYGGLMATLTSWCEDRAIPYTAVPVGAIKKFWTGNGSAGKDAMILAGAAKGYSMVKDDNEMDAIALWHNWEAGSVR